MDPLQKEMGIDIGLSERSYSNWSSQVDSSLGKKDRSWKWSIYGQIMLGEICVEC